MNIYEAYKILEIITKYHSYPLGVKITCAENRTVEGLIHFAMMSVIILFNFIQAKPSPEHIGGGGGGQKA